MVETIYKVLTVIIMLFSSFNVFLAFEDCDNRRHLEIRIWITEWLIILFFSLLILEKILFNVEGKIIYMMPMLNVIYLFILYWDDKRKSVGD